MKMKRLLSILMILLLAGCTGTKETRLKFEGPSMMPTIQDQDVIIVDETYYDTNEVQRGEIILVNLEVDSLHAKRVIGLPNEHIEMKNGQLFVDEEPAGEDLILQESPVGDFEALLDEDEFFIIGDALDSSRDSRHFGPITKENVQGKVMKIKGKSKK